MVPEVLPGIRYRQQGRILPQCGGKMFGMGVGVMGDCAKVGCTGRYDNISFKMKTTCLTRLAYAESKPV